MINIVALRPTAKHYDNLNDGLVSLAVGLRSAADYIGSVDLSPAERHAILFPLLEAVKQISQAAMLVERLQQSAETSRS